MWQRLVLFFLLAGAAYFIVKRFEGFADVPQPVLPHVVSTPMPAPVIYEPPARGPMSVSPSGPNPPNQEADPNMPPERAPLPEANDPYDVTVESAHAPENITHPERNFGPGIVPETAAIGVGAGVASQEVGVSSQAFQQFSPENVTSGGSFFGGVSAMVDENPNYSAF